MSLALQIILSLSVVTLTVFLVLLLIQARKTAAAAERLAESAIRDMRQVADDIHDVRQHVDEIVSHTRSSSMNLPAMLTHIAAGAVQALPNLFRRPDPGDWLNPLLTGIQTAIRLVRRFRANHSKEPSHE